MDNLAEKRIGTVKRSTYGSLMEIIYYKNSQNVIIYFPKYENIMTTTWQCFCRGNIKNPYDRNVCGVGYIGEGKYTPSIGYRQLSHQYYLWYGMMQRVYDFNYQKRYPTYKDCSVSEVWHNFQNFAAWFDQNYYEIEWEKMNLDKDILVKGNKIYSPETCIFVPKNINSLFIRRRSERGNLPIGVSFSKSGKYIAQCGDNKGGKIFSHGHETPEKAFNTYKIIKEKIIKEVANNYKGRIPEKLYETMINYVVEIND